MTRLSLALKAEVVFAILLTVRHRTVRLVLAFAASIVALRTLGAGGSHHGSILLVAGSVGVVAASRTLARGAALEAVRRTAGSWWLPPAGRLLGISLLVAAVAAAAALVLADDVSDAARTWSMGVTYAVALSGLTAALAPVAGATAAGTTGLLAAWIGTMPPSTVDAALARWRFLAVPAVSVWNALPLEWRAARWLRTGGIEDLAIFALWIPAAVALSAWAAARAYRGEAAPAGGS